MTAALLTAAAIWIAVRIWQLSGVPTYEMRHNDLPNADPMRFGLDDAPVWLTSSRLWIDEVLSLKPGQSIRTKYRTITRVK